MNAESSRFVSFWAAADQRARVWFRACVVLAAALVLSLVAMLRLFNKPREVIRVGCDGIPQVIRLNDSYSEPNDLELRAFASEFAVYFARADSYSIVNDYVRCAQRMVPELREAFKREARGEGGRPGVIAVIEGLRRRTEVPTSSLEVTTDKTNYPWRAHLKGTRQIVGSGEASGEAFSLDLELVRTERTLENPFGLLIWKVRSEGGPVVAPTTQGR